MKLHTTLAAGLLAFAPLPAFAQDEAMEDTDAAIETDAAGLDAVMGMLGGLFASEPLTAEEEARLPAAAAVVGTIMPEGFYAEMMGEMMDTTMRPMFAMFTGPSFTIAERTGADLTVIETLDEDEQRAIAKLLDPAYDTRADAMVEGMVSMMGDMFAVVEPPMREGLAKAYAKRFTTAQLGDISAFFATPTGEIYATESMRLFADPEVMGATMQAMPAMLGSIGDMTQAMQALEASMPKPATYADLSSAERARIAGALGIAEDELRSQMEAAQQRAEEKAAADAMMAEMFTEDSAEEGVEEAAD